MFGKSQSSLIVLVAIATVIILGWIFSIFLQQSYQSIILASEAFSKLAKHSDITKGMSRAALAFAVDQATKDIAEMEDTYINNVPDTPTLDEMRSRFSGDALKNLNKHLPQFVLSERLIDYHLYKYTCVDSPLQKEELDIGLYDEKFPVGAYGSTVSLQLGDNLVSSKNDIFETISRNRFWFLYRKFKLWADKAVGGENKIIDDFCDCLRFDFCIGLSSDQFKQCVGKSLEDSRKLLEQIINDPYVKCSVEIICEEAEWSMAPPPKPSGCYIWPESKCRPKYTPRSDNLCINKISFQGQTIAPPPPEQPEVRGAVTATFSCIDEKYELSTTPTKDRHIIFKVNVALYKQYYCQED